LHIIRLNFSLLGTRPEISSFRSKASEVDSSQSDCRSDYSRVDDANIIVGEILMHLDSLPLRFLIEVMTRKFLEESIEIAMAWRHQSFELNKAAELISPINVPQHIHFHLRSWHENLNNQWFSDMKIQSFKNYIFYLQSILQCNGTHRRA